jgi:hypothetical protein
MTFVRPALPVEGFRADCLAPRATDLLTVVLAIAPSSFNKIPIC